MLSACQVSQSTGQTLVWSDEFDYVGAPDVQKWDYDLGDACDLPAGCGWGNDELQYYTTESAYVDGEKLIITLDKSSVLSGTFTSARLATRGKASWKYGTFEIKAKVADCLGCWSAIWMLPETNEYGGWPKSGEIDIMEHVGSDPDTIKASVHCESYNHIKGTHKNGAFKLSTAAEEFHKYKLVWTEDFYETYVNDQRYFRYEKESDDSAVWPFQQNFHLLLNLAYGGNLGGSKGIKPEELPSKLEIDYVRIYQ